MNYNRQRDIIYDPENKDATKVPEMPLLIILDNDIIGEASSIRGSFSVSISPDYYVVRDFIAAYNLEELNLMMVALYLYGYRFP